MKHIRFIIMLIFIILLTIPIPVFSQIINQPKKNILFTLVKSYGDSVLPEAERLSVRLGAFIAVNNNEDVYVSDERQIKVYKKDGTFKTMMNYSLKASKSLATYYYPISPTSITNFWISSKDYLSVLKDGCLAVYSPDNKLVKEIVLSETPEGGEFYINSDRITSYSNIKAFAVDDNIFIYAGHNLTAANPNNEFNELILVSHYGLGILVAKYQLYYLTAIKNERQFSSIQSAYLGKLYYGMLSDNRIVYTHTQHDVKVENEVGQCTFHIYSVDDFNTKTFVYQFAPQAFTKLHLKTAKGGISVQYLETQEGQKIVSRLEKMKFFPPFEDMVTDGNYVFLFPDKRVRRFIVLNATTEKTIGTFEYDLLSFSQVILGTFEYDLLSFPQVIRNGYAYIMGSPSVKRVVEKYKIDPTVYEK